MTDESLRSALGRAAGAPTARPDIGGIWRDGRARRRRTRVRGAAAAVAAVALLVAGAVALATGDDAQDVMAGPGGGGAQEAAPPPEPASSVIVLVGTPADEDGVPLIEPSGSFTIELEGPEEVARSPWFQWEAWDGAAWSAQHTLLPGGTDEPPQVLGPEEGWTMSSTVPVGRPAGPLLVPDAPPGWYRVCNQLHGVAAGPGAPASVPVDGRVCGQLRVVERIVVDDGPSPTTEPVEPPPEEPVDPSASVVVDDVEPVHPDAVVPLVLHWAGGTLGGNTTWEQWSGLRWVPTHLIESFTTTRGGPELTSLMGPGAVAVPDVAYSTDAAETPLQVRVPPADELRSPWSRVCVDIGGEDTDRPCARLEVDDEPEEVDLDFVEERAPWSGDDATWTIDPASPPAPTSTTVSVLVSRVGCSDGTTGEVLDPQISLEQERIVITIDVVPEEGMHTCPGNDAVPVTVPLGEAIGDRDLVDGWCDDATARPEPALVCDPAGEVRWSPP